MLYDKIVNKVGTTNLYIFSKLTKKKKDLTFSNTDFVIKLQTRINGT